MTGDVELLARYRVLMEKVQTMKAGGNLEALLEGEFADLKKLINQKAVENREAASGANPEAFPPSGMPDVQDRLAQKAKTGKANSRKPRRSAGI